MANSETAAFSGHGGRIGMAGAALLVAFAIWLGAYASGAVPWLGYASVKSSSMGVGPISIIGETSYEFELRPRHLLLRRGPGDRDRIRGRDRGRQPLVPCLQAVRRHARGRRDALCHQERRGNLDGAHSGKRPLRHQHPAVAGPWRRAGLGPELQRLVGRPPRVRRRMAKLYGSRRMEIEPAPESDSPIPQVPL